MYCTYVEVRSGSHCYNGKSISITYSEFMSVALGFQNAKSMRRIVICGLYGCKIFLHIFYWTARFSEGKKNIENKMCFDFLCKSCLKCFSFEEEFIEIWPWMYLGLHDKYPICFSDFNEPWIFLANFWENLRYQISRKSVPWEPSCFMQRTDRQTKILRALIKITQGPGIA
jgi:hypothetical protein